TTGATCAKVIRAASDGELAGALATAGEGDCIALGPGTYGPVTLPGGVSLLGRSAADVRVASVAIGPGSGSWLRGLDLAGGLDAGSATDVRVEAVRIHGGDDGVHVGKGGSVTIVTSEIRDTGTYGVLATQPAGVTIERTVIEETGFAGG